MVDIGVVYLYRFAEGECPVRTFLESYRVHPPGVGHDLHVIFKGFPNRDSSAAARALFKDLPINAIEIGDFGFDINAYFAAASAISNRRLIFFNTFSELLSDNWLLRFDNAFRLPSVGLVGATGSWQSHFSLFEANLKRDIERVRYWAQHPLSYFERTRIASDDAKDFKMAERPSSDPRYPRRNRDIAHAVRALRSLMRVRLYVHYRRNYSPYPNPHIRTNAFMIDRDRFLALRNLAPRTKFDAYKFESGNNSLTRQVMAQGLKPVVVDRTGKVYDISEWKQSSTLWSDDQINLVVADNRTREYAVGDFETRLRLENHAWVDPSSWALL